MLIQNKSQLKTGNWIKGRTQNGELIVGYIEFENFVNESIEVAVVSSDNNEIIGKKIRMLKKSIEPLPDSTEKNKNQLLFLMDLALSTRDENWFNELCSDLQSVKDKELKI